MKIGRKTGLGTGQIYGMLRDIGENPPPGRRKRGLRAENARAVWSPGITGCSVKSARNASSTRPSGGGHVLDAGEAGSEARRGHRRRRALKHPASSSQASTTGARAIGADAPAAPKPHYGCASRLGAECRRFRTGRRRPRRRRVVLSELQRGDGDGPNVPRGSRHRK